MCVYQIVTKVVLVSACPALSYMYSTLVKSAISIPSRTRIQKRPGIHSLLPHVDVHTAHNMLLISRLLCKFSTCKHIAHMDTD